MAVRTKNRGLAYLRRSSGRQEASLETQLQWAINEASRIGMPLRGSLADLERMKTGKLHSYQDIRLDDSVTGADLTRPGFLALQSDALSDRSISHLFIYRRDRFARPEDAIRMVSL